MPGDGRWASTGCSIHTRAVIQPQHGRERSQLPQRGWTEDVMLRGISGRRRTDTGRLHFCEVPGGVRVTETGNRVGASDWEDGESVFVESRWYNGLSEFCESFQ